MSNFDFFSNIGFPVGCTYNLTGNVTTKCEGGADIEHHFEVDGQKNVWLQKRQNKEDENWYGYAELASTRVSNSG